MAPFFPQADMLAVSKSSRVHRKPIAALPGLTFMDADLEKVDKFYFNCQDHRDYSRDSYNKLPCPAAFRTYKGKCGVKLDSSISLLCQPVIWMIEEKPVVYPVELGKDISCDARFHLSGRFQKATNTSFKR